MEGFVNFHSHTIGANKEKGEDGRIEIGPMLPNKIKYLSTLAIFFGNITFGCCFNFFAPALKDFEAKFDTDIDNISKVFTVFLVSYCVGALISGFMYNIINRQVGVIICLGCMGLGLYVAPHVPSKTLFFVTGGFIGFFGGCYDTANVVWMMEMWQSKSGPYIQGQHFFYAVGSNIPSLIIAPFLSNKDDDDEETMTTTTTTTMSPDAKDSQIYIPFTIAGILSTLACSFQIFLFIFFRYFKPPLEEDLADAAALELENNNNSNDKSEKSLEIENEKSMNSTSALHEDTKQGFNWLKVKLIVLTVMFLGFYQGTEMCSMEFIPTFGQHSDLQMTEKKSTYPLTALTAAFAIGRFFGIFLIFKVPPQLMLCANLSLLILGNVIILIWANNNLTMWWVACGLLGAGLSTAFPSFCAYMERHLLFTNAVGSACIVVGSGTAAIYPLIVGTLIEENAVVLTYVNFFSLLMCTFALAYASKLTYGNKKRVM